MWKKVISLFLVLCMLITMVGCFGNPLVPTINSETENSFSEEFVLVQVKDPESNIIFVTGKENEDAMAILGDKDTEVNPTNVTGAVYVSGQGDSFSIEAGIDGLPTYLIDSEGNKVIFKNYTNSTVDISIYDSNENLIEGPTTINVDPEDLLEIKQLYSSFYSKQRWSKQNTADALKWGAVGLSAVGCGLALYGTVQTGGALALTPAVGWACGKASLSLIAAVTPNDTDNIISMAIGTGSCLISGGADVWGCESTILSIIAYGESQSISTIETYIITASAGSHGSISPSGNVTVNQGADKSFTITPDTGYSIDDVLVDGISVGAVSSYTFTNVTENHIISADFTVSSVLPRVLFDDTHNPINGYASISTHFAPLISYLEDVKYIVEIGNISNLEDYDILVLADPHVKFNTSEITSIRTFLQKGGKLVMLGEHGRYSDNSAINALSIALGIGITLSQDKVCDDTDNYQDTNYWPLISNFVSHAVTTDISTVVIGAGSSLNVTSPATVVTWSDPDSYEVAAFNKQIAETISSPSSKPMLLKRSKAQGPFIIIAVSEVNDGKVFVVGDTSLWGYHSIDFFSLYDNEKLAKNVFSW